MELLKSWLAAERGRNTAMAAALKVRPSFVTKMALGIRPIPIEHMAAIERFTQGAVTRQEMCPSDWHRIWPELAEKSEPNIGPALEIQAEAAISQGA